MLATHIKRLEKIEEIGNTSHLGLHTLYRITLPRRVKYAKELINDLMENINAVKANTDFIHYSNDYSYEDNEILIEKGLIRKSGKVVGNR